jgi:hypothetical protein
VERPRRGITSPGEEHSSRAVGDSIEAWNPERDYEAIGKSYMILHFKELPGWRFDTDEVSPGVYKAWGSDALGRRVEMTVLTPMT